MKPESQDEDPKVVRARFNAQEAPTLAAKAGLLESLPNVARSKRFAYFKAPGKFGIVVGAQEESEASRALAYGLTYRGEDQLVVVLPRGFEFPTVQRASWLGAKAQPELFVHENGQVDELALPTREEAEAALVKKGMHGYSDLHEELRAASAPMHLRHDAEGTFKLAEWATKHHQLDPSHRRSERSWQCMGQRVLSIKRTKTHVEIRAGIHTGEMTADVPTVALAHGAFLSEQDLRLVEVRVQEGIDARLRRDGGYHKADEHWLQAEIRKDPTLVGVEQPALREVPAWRPTAGELANPKWGRGYIDLVGVDGHGDIRIVETKLANNTDDLLVLQGLDYYLWARAYGRVLRERLGASSHARIVVHYVIGARGGGDVIRHSPFLPGQIKALHPEYSWRFQEVRHWFTDSEPPTAKLLEAGEIPAST